jgi:hypothetical protein
MTTRCKPGDLAIILHDAPQCAANIGRVVEIFGPPAIDRHGRLTWLIKPVTPESYWVNNSRDDSIRPMTDEDQDIEHPDEWMQPIQPGHDQSVVDCHGKVEVPTITEDALA